VGYELCGEPQRDMTPEQAATRLRDLPTVLYRDLPETSPSVSS
jgi:UDPglucose--hexose-1-phosphate uridylyltransferase